MKTLLLLLPLILPAQPARTPEGFSLPQPGHVFSFPKDLGSHPDFRIEWWYVTGHLASEAGRRFGFQATFFRLAGPPSGPDANPDFSQREVFLAHMALSAPANPAKSSTQNQRVSSLGRPAISPILKASIWTGIGCVR